MAIDPGIRRVALGTLLAALPGTSAPEDARQLIRDGLAGFTLFGHNIASDDQLRALTAALHADRPDTMVALDEEGGDVTRLAHTTGSPYPGNAALGIVDDPSVTRRIYHAIGTELAAVGITINFAPAVDVNTVNANPIIGTRSFGADPTMVATHARAAVTGLQAAGVAACAKHYPGHGATREDSHLQLPTVDASTAVLRTRDLPPFAAVIDAGVPAIMTAHIRVPALTGYSPATFSPAALALLRQEYGFTGVIVSDALEMAGAAATAGGIGPAAVRALRSGVDLLCLGKDIDMALVDTVVRHIAAAVASGELPATRLAEAVERNEQLASGHGSALAHAINQPADSVSGPDTVSGQETTPLPELGYQTAQRAIQVHGTLAGLAGALVVQLESGFNIAEGRVPWGLRPHLGESAVQTLDPADTSPEQVRRLAGHRPVVVVGRHLHRVAATRALVDILAAAHPCAVVEMGWPASWRPASAQAFVTTYGASHANGAALAAVLAL